MESSSSLSPVPWLLGVSAQMNAAPVAACVHWWLLEPANGPVSRGVCRFCHEARLFSNVEAYITNDWGTIPLNNVGKTRFDKRGGRR